MKFKRQIEQPTCSIALYLLREYRASSYDPMAENLIWNILGVSAKGITKKKKKKRKLDIGSREHARQMHVNATK